MAEIKIEGEVEWRPIMWAVMWDLASTDGDRVLSVWTSEALAKAEAEDLCLLWFGFLRVSPPSPPKRARV